jgi:hypothetical protein
VLQHDADRRLRAQEHAANVHRVQAIEIVRRRVVDGADVGDAGVVDEDVEAAERRVDLIEAARDGVGIRNLTSRASASPPFARMVATVASALSLRSSTMQRAP